MTGPAKGDTSTPVAGEALNGRVKAVHRRGVVVVTTSVTANPTA
jgi:hypothetical protein